MPAHYPPALRHNPNRVLHVLAQTTSAYSQTQTTPAAAIGATKRPDIEPQLLQHSPWPAKHTNLNCPDLDPDVQTMHNDSSSTRTRTKYHLQHSSQTQTQLYNPIHTRVLNRRVLNRPADLFAALHAATAAAGSWLVPLLPQYCSALESKRPCSEGAVCLRHPTATPDAAPSRHPPPLMVKWIGGRCTIWPPVGH